MFDKIGNLSELLRNASKIREGIEKAGESLGQIQVEGSSGGGAVTARVSGRLEVLSVRIDPKLLADGDAELLEDLVALAVNQGLTKAREAAAKALQEAAGGLPMPPGLGNLFGS